jgi:hypothetical protein
VVVFRTRSAPDWLMLATMPLVTGCIPIMNNPPYPIDWSPAALERVGSCPAIAGTYVNQGSLYIEAGIGCSTPRRDGRWSCDLELAPNLGIAGSAVTVEITQPDAQTMNVRLLDENATAQHVATLLLGKDYQCDADTLYFSSAGSMVEARALSGAVFNHKRAFVRDAKGELVMKVRDDTTALMIFIGIVKSDTSYVRWIPALVAEPGPIKAP